MVMYCNIVCCILDRVVVVAQVRMKRRVIFINIYGAITGTVPPDQICLKIVVTDLAY